MLTNENHLNMAPPGWDKLVRNLDSAISLIHPEYEIIQVKEKFGMLRFYIDFASINDDDSLKISDLITAAEKDSMTLCQNCGSRLANKQTILNPMRIKPTTTICGQCGTTGNV